MKLDVREGFFEIQCSPLERMHLARMFPYFKAKQRTIDNPPLVCLQTPNNARDLEWFFFRFKPEFTVTGKKVYDKLLAESYSFEELNRRIDEGYKVVKPSVLKASGNIKLRDYQETAVNFFLGTERMILGDQTGLGKTFVSLGLTEKLGRTIIFCDPHLAIQFEGWYQEYFKGVSIHVLQRSTVLYTRTRQKDGKKYKETAEYDIPDADVYIVSYGKCGETELARKLLSKDVKFVVFDECQALRRRDSRRYRFLSEFKIAPFKLGLSATPIFNYGDEIFNILSVIDDSVLGSEKEFLENWCYWGRVSDPKALGEELRKKRKFLRRKKSDVYKNVMKIERCIKYVDFNSDVYKDYVTLIRSLSQKVMTGDFEEAGVASRELNALVRSKTGLAKAQGVCNFTKMLLEDGRKVVLCGWHRKVYDEWLKHLEAYNPVLYTGSETAKQKNYNKDRFVNGDSRVLILSLRSGQGLDGLQHASSDIVFGELDWSPAVHEQCEGRLFRDGQKEVTTAFYLNSNFGSDPIMLQTLGIKKNQAQGIVNPKDEQDLTEQVFDTKNIKRLAENLLSGV